MTTPTMVASLTGEYPIAGAGTTHLIPYPSGIAGDLVIAVVAYGDLGSTTISSWPGWTAIGSRGFFGVVDGRAEVWYRVTDGSEGSTSTLTTSQSVSLTYDVRRIRDFVGVPVAAGWVNNAGGQPAYTDPPDCTSGFGAVETMWIACGVFANNRVATGYPSGYTDGHYFTSGTNGGPNVATAYKDSIAASDDPGQITFNSTSWQTANTVAVMGSGTPLVGVPGSMEVGLIG